MKILKILIVIVIVIIVLGFFGYKLFVAMMFGFHPSNYLSHWGKEFLSCGYVKQGGKIYLEYGFITSNFDKSKVDSFKYDNTNYMQGRVRRYYQIPYIDAETFKVINDSSDSRCRDSYGIDKNHVYFGGEIVNGLPPDEFNPLGFGFSQSKDNIFFKVNKVANFDRDSFAVLPGRDGFEEQFINFVKDKNGVYYVETYSFGKADGVYYAEADSFGKVDIAIDPDSFKRVESNYISDKNGLYYMYQNEDDGLHFSLRKLENVTPNDFDVIAGVGSGLSRQMVREYDCSPHDSAFIVTHDAVYLCGQEIEGITPHDFCSEHANNISKDYGSLASSQKTCAKYGVVIMRK